MATSMQRSHEKIIDSLNAELFEGLRKVLHQNRITYIPDFKPKQEQENSQSFVIWVKSPLEKNEAADKKTTIPYGNTTQFQYSLNNIPIKKFTTQSCFQKEQINSQQLIEIKKIKISCCNAEQNNEIRRQLAKIANSVFNYYRHFFYSKSELCLAEMPIQVLIAGTGDIIVTYLPKLKNLRFYAVPLTGGYQNTKRYMCSYAQEIYNLQCELEITGFFRSQETTCN